MSSKKYNCYKVRVKTTNALKTAYVKYTTSTMQAYGECVDGILYVMAETYDGVEDVVGDNILSIELIGTGYVHQPYKE